MRGFEERRLSGEGGYFISEKQLRGHDNDHLANAMRSYIPGINWVVYRTMTFAESQRGHASFQKLPKALPYDGHSPQGCWVSVWMDGVRIYDPDGSMPAPDFESLNVNQFAGVEYYAGAATTPMAFRAMAAGDCGVLLLWTRER